MLTIKQILTIAEKELRLWLQTPGNWLTILLVPFAFIALLGAVFGGGTPVFTIFAANEDKGDLGADVIKQLQDAEAQSNYQVEKLQAAVVRATQSDKAKKVVA